MKAEAEAESGGELGACESEQVLRRCAAKPEGGVLVKEAVKAGLVAGGVGERLKHVVFELAGELLLRLKGGWEVGLGEAVKEAEEAGGLW